MSNLGAMKGPIGDALRRKRGIGTTGVSGKRFKGSTQYTGMDTVTDEGAGNNSAVNPGARPKRPRVGPARTALSR